MVKLFKKAKSLRFLTIGLLPERLKTHCLKAFISAAPIFSIEYPSAFGSSRLLLVVLLIRHLIKPKGAEGRHLNTTSMFCEVEGLKGETNYRQGEPLQIMYLFI